MLHSFLDGAEWVLRTRVQRSDDAGNTLTHDAVVHATDATRDKWNAQFWQLFPADPAAFDQLAQSGDINVKVMFRFRPTARVKQTYGGQPVLQIARSAESVKGSLKRLPRALANAIDEYERDKRMLDSQRRQAWVELFYLRLPHPPAGFEWELTSGDPRFYGDLLNFRLSPRR